MDVELQQSTKPPIYTTLTSLLSDYKFLGVMRRQFPRVPILGLTATATTSVVADVKKILGITDCVVFKASFNRRNLFYEVRMARSVVLAGGWEIAQLVMALGW